LTTEGDVTIEKGARLDDVAIGYKKLDLLMLLLERELDLMMLVHHQKSGSHDEKEFEDINICLNLFKTTLQF
jgi:hypothetical protein